MTGSTAHLFTRDVLLLAVGEGENVPFSETLQKKNPMVVLVSGFS